MKRYLESEFLDRQARIDRFACAYVEGVGAVGASKASLIKHAVEFAIDLEVEIDRSLLKSEPDAADFPTTSYRCLNGHLTRPLVLKTESRGGYACTTCGDFVLTRQTEPVPANGPHPWDPEIGRCIAARYAADFEQAEHLKPESHVLRVALRDVPEAFATRENCAAFLLGVLGHVPDGIEDLGDQIAACRAQHEAEDERRSMPPVLK